MLWNPINRCGLQESRQGIYTQYTSLHFQMQSAKLKAESLKLSIHISAQPRADLKCECPLSSIGTPPAGLLFPQPSDLGYAMHARSEGLWPTPAAAVLWHPACRQSACQTKVWRPVMYRLKTQIGCKGHVSGWCNEDSDGGGQLAFCRGR